jgi:hypothetical protein
VERELCVFGISRTTLGLSIPFPTQCFLCEAEGE